jgi:Protein of unknown function (DUF2442)
MYWDVITIKPVAPLTIEVVFADDTSGQVKFATGHLTGVFEPLKNDAFFLQVFVNNGVVTWPGEIDLAPDAMYVSIKKYGEWFLN